LDTTLDMYLDVHSDPIAREARELLDRELIDPEHSTFADLDEARAKNQLINATLVEFREALESLPDPDTEQWTAQHSDQAIQLLMAWALIDRGSLEAEFRN